MSHNLIPHSRPMIGEEEAKAVADAVRSGHVSQCDRVREFEESLAGFTGVKGAAAVNSGTSALHLGMLAAGIGRGDGVLMPSFVCTAPLNAVYHAGAEPVICDIEPESFNIAAEDISDKRTDSSKAVIVPHMFGSPADLEKIEGTGLALIEDCAHSVGAVYGDKKVGSIGRFGIVSFYANKMLACGEGGAVLSDDEGLLAEVRDMRDYDEKEDYRARFNYKMTDMQGALGLVQLKKLPGMIARRKELAARYDEAFEGLDAVLPRGEFDHVYYRYVIRVKKDVTELLKQLMGKSAVCARPVYKPLHRYLELRSGFQNTDEAYSSTVSVPLYPSLTDDQQERVIMAVRRYLG